jgi:hypothetical protein
MKDVCLDAQMASFFHVQAGLHDSFYGVVGGATLSFDDHYLVCHHTLFFFFLLNMARSLFLLIALVESFPTPHHDSPESFLL